MRNIIENRVVVNGYNPIPLGFAKQLDDITLKLDLYDKNGNRFVDELLPRDVVTKAIQEQMKKDGTDHVWLSLEKKSSA